MKNIFTLIIALVFVVATIIAAYAVIYLAFLRHKRPQIGETANQDEKGSDNATNSNIEKPKKGDYGYCELNDIVGFELIQVKDLSRKPVLEEKTSRTESETYAEQEDPNPPVLGTTGRNGYDVTDDEVPSAEEIAKRKAVQEELLRQEKEREEIERKKQEEKKAKQETDFVSEQDIPDDEANIHLSLQDHFAYTGEWTEVYSYDESEDPYEKNLNRMNIPDEEPDDNMPSQSVQEVMRAYDISENERAEIESKLNSLEKPSAPDF